MRRGGHPRRRYTVTVESLGGPPLLISHFRFADKKSDRFDGHLSLITPPPGAGLTSPFRHSAQSEPDGAADLGAYFAPGSASVGFRPWWGNPVPLLLTRNLNKPAAEPTIIAPWFNALLHSPPNQHRNCCFCAGRKQQKTLAVLRNRHPARVTRYYRFSSG